jgi:hypothetical protein
MEDNVGSKWLIPDFYYDDYSKMSGSFKEKWIHFGSELFRNGKVL